LSEGDRSKEHFIEALKFSVPIVCVLWLVHTVNFLTGNHLGHWGIFPRELDGLKGIITAPFIHGSWEHLFSNSAPFLVTTTLIHFFYRKAAWPSFIFIYLLTGALVWMFGRSVYHIGASGVVYGLVSFIFWSGVFRRNIKSIVLALIVTILYSGYLQGIIPFQDGISWESHLIGGLVGILVAFWFRGMIELDEEDRDPWANENMDTEYYLPRDTFDMTREERRIKAQRDAQEAWLRQQNQDSNLGG